MKLAYKAIIGCAFSFKSMAMDNIQEKNINPTIDTKIVAALLVYNPNEREMVVIKDYEQKKFLIPTCDVSNDVTSAQALVDHMEQNYQFPVDLQKMELCAELNQSYLKNPKGILSILNTVAWAVNLPHRDESVEKKKFTQEHNCSRLVTQCYYVACYKPYPKKLANLVFKPIDKIISHKGDLYQPTLITNFLKLGPALRYGSLTKEKLAQHLKIESLKNLQIRFDLYVPRTFLALIEKGDQKYVTMTKELDQRTNKTRAGIEDVGTVIVGGTVAMMFAERQCTIL